MDYTEFIIMTIDKKNVINDVRIENCFKMFDSDQNGRISINEFQGILQGNQNIT